VRPSGLKASWKNYLVYKAFISSTFEDLRQHRAEAIRTLQAAGLLVDPMENWQADRDTPTRFSAARLDGCRLCILLVAFRCGSTPDGTAQSITQIEYDEARRRRIDVLPFLLSDQTPVGDGGWNPAFDDRTGSSAIDVWRRTLRQTHGIGEFGSDPKSLRIEAALARWVVQSESDRAKRFRNIVTSLVAGFFLLVAAAVSYAMYRFNTPELRNRDQSRYLAFHDPVAFNHASNGQYSVARVLANRAALTQDTNFPEEMLATRSSLDFLANNVANTRYHLIDNFRRIVRNGATVRLILWDYSPDNEGYAPFQEAIGQTAAEARPAARQARMEVTQMQEDLAKDPGSKGGRFELRWNRLPLFYTMWIRDWEQQNRQNALGHLGVHLYRGQTFWPFFRVSARDGSDLLDNLHEEFNYAWEHATLKAPKD
jgi:hypothetical protein